jgi:hypothetical protein
MISVTEKFGSAELANRVKNFDPKILPVLQGPIL